MQLDEGELGRAVDGDAQVEAPFRCADLGQIDRKSPRGQALKRDRSGLSPSNSGNRPIPWRSRQRCSDERVRRGMVAWNAERRSSSGRSVWRRKATTTASSPGDSAVDSKKATALNAPPPVSGPVPARSSGQVLISEGDAGLDDVAVLRGAVAGAAEAGAEGAQREVAAADVVELDPRVLAAKEVLAEGEGRRDGEGQRLARAGTGRKCRGGITLKRLPLWAMYLKRPASAKLSVKA